MVTRVSECRVCTGWVRYSGIQDGRAGHSDGWYAGTTSRVWRTRVRSLSVILPRRHHVRRTKHSIHYCRKKQKERWCIMLLKCLYIRHVMMLHLHLAVECSISVFCYVFMLFCIAFILLLYYTLVSSLSSSSSSSSSSCMDLVIWNKHIWFDFLIWFDLKCVLFCRLELMKRNNMKDDSDDLLIL